MLRMVLLSVPVLCLMLCSPGAFSEDRYQKLMTYDHGGINFKYVEDLLIGTWKSDDAKVNYSESWMRSNDGLLTGIRKFDSEDGYKFPEYHLFAFLPQRNGPCLDMRRMVRLPGDPMSSDFTANWHADYTNKVTITCSGKYDNQETKIVSDYDSPSAGQLDVTMVVTTQPPGQEPKSWKHTYHLVRTKE